MFTVTADIAKNRLYVSLVGYFNYEQMKECTDKTIIELRKLKPGFDVITDISQFKPLGQDTLVEVERAQAQFKKSGIRHGIRVEGKAKLTSIQFSRIGKTVDYIPDTVETIEEAEKLLDSKVSQEKNENNS
ncbi:MAG: hypothetical protein A2Y58_00475 [Chloroflexi bacterium RBG_13_51_52]|nr:MAG: hypothetical protein A2Y58_00475 [Chloroflexi bacterium RBG_13_51_52]